MMSNKPNVCQLTGDDEQPTRKIIDFYKKIVHNRLKNASHKQYFDDL
jgi:hypothetical protein